MTILKFSGMAAILLTTASPALADNNNGYGVATAARARNAYSFVDSVSTYRTGADSSTNYTRPGDTPSTAYNSCSAYPSNVTCVATTTGTNSSDYNLLASSNYANLTDNIGYDPNTFAFGEASGRASLVSGELGAYAYSNIWRSVLSGPTFIGAQSYAQLNDTLTFLVAGADNSTVTNIGVSFQLDGITTVIDSHGLASIGANLHFGNSNARYSFQDQYGLTSDYLGNSDAGWVSSSWDLSRPGVVTFNGVYALSGISSVLGIYHDLIAHAGAGASSNYGSTSHLRLTLPNTVTYTSASGVFLSETGQTGAVPEPGTWAMLIFGFGLVGATMRRRQTSQAFA